MAKSKIIYVCQECGYSTPKWLGRCPECGTYSSLVEEPVKAPPKAVQSARPGMGGEHRPAALKDISIQESHRKHTGILELDRVLGGGIVEGSLVLVGGDPGIGKSTLLLQMCLHLADAGVKVLYVTGEESLHQIKLRANRLGGHQGLMEVYAQTEVDRIEESILETSPDIVVIDSIQTLYADDIGSAPGSVSQVRESTARLMRLAKSKRHAIFIVGHVTKEGAIAGPRVLEHMVDTVLYFEGERTISYRILRAVKNRYGSTNEIGVFEMGSQGLVEVPNPSEYMLNGRPMGEAGSVVSCCMEGTRPLLVEVQALLSRSNFQMPRRTVSGMDMGRANLLLAVLEKKLRMNTGEQDVYLNVAGGIRVLEPALDLGIVAAVLSSFRNQAVDEKTVFMGEVGLTGEVRGVTHCPQRVREAAKLGFQRCILPKANLAACRDIPGVACHGVESVRELQGLL
ncbi:DNA repair protein RadA [Anaerotalea alkaliphila]|uniref:DNA repair protein RadA n=1 Tax=Anaerotalea alkaliphila TaxID=2662126 RepID=A0A7X5KMT2_9FIRM|nr:DNA repair protein RadA [Anaerotalea alkaliphila]